MYAHLTNAFYCKGITLEEKRDIGCKMCGTLLDKINFDLAIARTDNQVDMRYLINMDYSSDMPINSMGRRVRSRLYFTSESHLHSLLNVLRFSSFKTNCVKSPLSAQGQQILADASELCYLTQVVIRLFEDTQKPIEDPKRFRVEIWFSPGATATPMHMEMMYRENDASRFDTEKLQKISIEGLSCTQVEEYFAEAMKEGKPIREDGTDQPKEKKKKDKKNKSKEQKKTDAESTVSKPNNKIDLVEDVVPLPNETTFANEENAVVCVKTIDSFMPTGEQKTSNSRDDDPPESDVGRRAMLLGIAVGAAAIALLLSKGRGIKR